MLGFDLTDEQRELKELAHKFAEQEIIPRAHEYDEKEIFPVDVCEKAFAAGLMNFGVPKELGGPGLGVLDTCLIVEELNYGCAGISNAIGANDLATLPLLIAGNDEQKRTYLGALMKKLTFCAFAITEPGAGSDVAAMSTTYRREGDEFVINGTKHFISNGSLADWYVTFATSDKRLKHKGISCFVFPVERARHHAPPDAWQARAARGRHRRDLLRRRAHSRERAGRARGRRLQVRDGDLRQEPAGDRRDRDRNFAARARRMPQVLAPAQRVRAADREFPGDPVHDGRHGDQDRGDAAADLQGGVAGR